MGNRGRTVAIAMGALTVVLIAAALISSHRRSLEQFRSVSAAAAAIRGDLPQGTSRGKVVNWLEARRIGHSYNAAADQVIAFIHDAQKDETTRSDLRIVFRFDKNNRLSSFVVDEITAERHNEESKEPLLD